MYDYATRFKLPIIYRLPQPVLQLLISTKRKCFATTVTIHWPVIVMSCGMTIPTASSAMKMSLPTIAMNVVKSSALTLRYCCPYTV